MGDYQNSTENALELKNSKLNSLMMKGRELG